MPAKPAIYAQNVRQIAATLHLPTSPRKLKGSIAQVNAWMAEPGFPPRERQGWRRDQLREWLAAKDAKTAAATTEQPDLFASVEDKLARFAEPEKSNLRATLAKYIAGEASKWEEEKLVAKGLISAPVREDVAAPVPGAPLPPAESQKQLAVLLARHFSGRLKIDLSEQQIGNWKQGTRLPDGCPLPPAKVANRFDTQAWADWVERFIVPLYGVRQNPQGEMVKDVFQLAQESAAQREIDAAARERIELLAVQGKYHPVAEFQRDLDRLGATLNAAVTEHCERLLFGTMRGLIDTLGLSEPAKIEAVAAARDHCRHAADEFRKTLAECLNPYSNGHTN